MSLSVSNKSSLIGSAGKTCKTPSCRNHLLVEGIICILNPHFQTDGRPQSVSRRLISCNKTLDGKEHLPLTVACEKESSIPHEGSIGTGTDVG